ncbi:retrotransposon protein, putative, ty1-copia subclass [Tanacetum coccineum]|uniref:Retrotransposon protein, putative, ty1-copia subclass n=1 Tax=Tanacetum coccineum TaxID=301880 RepID=A0ABQ4ZF45_9ASTR
MHSMGKTIAELHAMLKLYDKGILKKAETPAVLVIQEGKIQKLAYAPKPKILPPPKREQPANDSIYHHCKEVGHWKRICLSYQAELKKRKSASIASTSSIFTIELYTFLIRLGYMILVAKDSVCHHCKEVGHYPKEMMGYYFYNPLENKIFVARNVEFFENNLIVQEVSECELGDLDEPSNYKDALSDFEFDKWLEAMNTKMQSIKANQVWVLVELPPNGQTVGSKWLFKKKTDMDGYVHTFKACLSAKGYTQTYDADYGETFSPIADIRAIRILLAIAAFNDYEIWFEVEIKKIDFTQNPNEPCVYLKASGCNVSFLILHVDDILLIGNNLTMLQEVKSWLCKGFSMKDLGEAAYDGKLQEGVYSNDRKPDYRKSQGAKTPSEVQRMRRVPYASVIGSIMYVVRCTRPDVAFAQNLCSHFQQNPGEIHWTAVKTILKYLRNTKDMVLMYGAKPEAELKVSCYADASFQTDKDDTKSQTRYVFVLNAEYIVAGEASMEAVWMRKFIDGLGNVVPSNKRPMEMLCDNEPAITIANDPGILKGARHFQKKYHYICEVIQEREIVLKKVRTDDNIADPFTKPMSFNKHFEHAMAIGIVPASSLM